MSRLMKQALRTVFALAVAGAFAFGTAQSLAAVAVAGCPDDGENFLGDCISEESCDIRCDLAGGTDGMCVYLGPNYCCSCLHR